MVNNNGSTDTKTAAGANGKPVKHILDNRPSAEELATMREEVTKRLQGRRPAEVFPRAPHPSFFLDI